MILSDKREISWQDADGKWHHRYKTREDYYQETADEMGIEVGFVRLWVAMMRMAIREYYQEKGKRKRAEVKKEIEKMCADFEKMGFHINVDWLLRLKRKINWKQVI